ncbi:MAG: transporter substrate-binding domain-containing protein [Eggerthellaceae bacterium]|nr:transporter substrate-binding domain-containing protein [Eggerthellaceae bacterium]
MKRTRMLVVICAIVACAALLLTGCETEQYTPQAKQQTISASALGAAGTLRVGVNSASAPLAGQSSSSSRIVGIDVDVASYIADQLGCKVEIIDVGNDPATALANNTVDLVLGVDTTEEETPYWCSDAYLKTGVALFGASAETAVPTVDSNPQIAAQASSKSSWRVTNLYGDDSLVAQDDLKSAFAALDSGAVQYVAADAVIGTYVSATNKFDCKIVALLQDASGYCAAVNTANVELQSAVSNAMNSLISGGIMNIIESKWLDAPLNLDGMTVVKSAAVDSDDKAKDKADDKKKKKS